MKLKDVPINAFVRDYANDTMFVVAAQDHPGYGGTTLITERLVGVGCLDAAEPRAKKKTLGHWDRVWDFGNNRYELSNIHQWLNSAEADWFRPAHEFDEPPVNALLRYKEFGYAERPGFLSGFSETFRSALREVEVPCIQRKGGRMNGELGAVKARVFLPSRTEIGKGDELGIPEGKMFPVFYNLRMYKAKPTEADMQRYGRRWNPVTPGNPEGSPHIYDPRVAWWFGLRTANMQYRFLNRVMCSYGAVSYTYANNDIVGIRPAMNLDGELEVSGDGGFDEIFTLVK